MLVVFTSDKLEYLDPEASPLYIDQDLNSSLDSFPQESKRKNNSNFKIPINEFKIKPVRVIVFFKVILMILIKLKFYKMLRNNYI